MSQPTPEWRWIDQDGVEHRASEAELKRLIASGAALPEVLVWRKGWPEWLPARQVPELATRARPLAVRSRVPPRAPESKGRDPLPTIDEEQAKPATGSTLRPPGAVPPPPRGVPPADMGFLSAAAPEHVRITPIDEVLTATASKRPDTVPPLSSPRPGTANEQHRRASVAPGRGSQAWMVPWLIAVGSLSLVTGVLAIVAIALSFRRPDPPVPPAPPENRSWPAPGISPSREGGQTETGCRVLRAAERLASPVEPAVPVVLAPTPDGRAVAVGYASTPSQAGAVTVEPGALRPSARPTPRTQARISGVVPVVDGDRLDFAIDTLQAGLKSPRTLARELLVGASSQGIARLLGGKSQELWALPSRAALTTPSAASLPGVYAVTFRSGGQSGKIHLGWLGADGARKSELGTVSEPGLVGTPAVGANGQVALVTYAARAGDAEHWRIRLAAARVGAMPVQLLAFDLPPGGPGVEAISPSATGLPGGRWLLQWTEGESGNRQVRAQTLGADLLPVGRAITLSGVQHNAGQGAVLGVGGRVLIVFMVIVDGHRELWGASVACAG